MTLAVRVDGLDYLSQLGRENIVNYTASAKTINAIIIELLALQVLTPAVTLGTIDGTIAAYTRSIQSDGWSILQVLQSLRETAGGYIEVDNDRHLNWSLTVGEDKGQQIRYRKNIEGFRRTIDFTTLANRIYAYGSGQGGARIALAAPGYIQDVPSQTLWGGIYAKSFVSQSFTIQATVTAWATQLLALYKTPLISYEINVANLALDTDFAFDELQLGSVVKVIDEDLGIDVSAKVTRIDYPDLMEPSRLVIQLSNRMRDLVDLLANVYETQQQQVAAQIDGSQVVSGDLPAARMQTNLATALAASTADLDDLDDGATYQRVKSIAIDASGMVLLDQVTDGTTYKLVKTASVTGGEIVLTSASMQVDKNGILAGTAGDTRVELKSTGLRGYNGAVLQFEVKATDGKAYFAGGDIVCDTLGISIDTTDSARFKMYRGAATGYLYLNNAGNLWIDTTGHIYLSSGIGKDVFWYGDLISADGADGSNLGTAAVYLNHVYTKILTMKETTTPSAVADSGKLYTKTDNKLYFQDGDGTEHEVAFA